MKRMTEEQKAHFAADIVAAVVVVSMVASLLWCITHWNG